MMMEEFSRYDSPAGLPYITVTSGLSPAMAPANDSALAPTRNGSEK